MWDIPSAVKWVAIAGVVTTIAGGGIGLSRCVSDLKEDLRQQGRDEATKQRLIKDIKDVQESKADRTHIEAQPADKIFLCVTGKVPVTCCGKPAPGEPDPWSLQHCKTDGRPSP